MIVADTKGLHPHGLPRRIDDTGPAEAGPTLIVVGGLHANEPAGIEAAQRVHGMLRGGGLPLRCGRLVSLRGNLTALSVEAAEPWLRARYIDYDLNRMFRSSGATVPGDSVEHGERQRLAQELHDITGQARGQPYLLDLHTVSSDSPAFIALEDTLPTRRFAAAIPLPKMLGLEEELDGLLIDYATHAFGCVSCIVEAGRHDDPRSADVHEAVLLLALSHLGMVAGPLRTSKGEAPRSVVSQAAAGRERDFYDVRERVAIGGASFAMQPGASAFRRVVAERTVVASEDGRPVMAPASGLLFLPNRQKSPRVGDDAFFVIARVGRFWLALSAWLRQRTWVHRWLPRLLPGVRARGKESGTILVAPEFAALLRREVLHLLGYRLVRWSHTPHMSWPRRLAGIAVALVRSIAGIVRFAPRGGERAALPVERETDWIARRHALDVRQRSRQDKENQA